MMPVEETHDVKITVPSTYAFFYTHYPELMLSEETSPAEEEQDSASEHHDPLFSVPANGEHIEDDDKSPLLSDIKEGEEMMGNVEHRSAFRTILDHMSWFNG
jgi:hypothetical protein